jgi:hypothetical protein
MQKKLGLDINRVHLHPYGFFLMCYDRNKWEDAKDAIIKSSIAVPKYCLKGPISKDLWVTHEEFNTFEIDPLPKSFPHPFYEGKEIHMDKETLTYDFELDEDIDCYMQYFIKCK